MRQQMRAPRNISIVIGLVGLLTGCGAQSLEQGDDSEQIGEATQAVAASAVVGFLEKGSQGTLDIFMDTENSGNADLLLKQGSNVNEPSITGIDRIPQPTQHGGVTFHVRQQTVTSLPRLQWDYVAFLFSNDCPANGYRFSEVFDNEDTDNQDAASGSVAPGWSRRDWTGTMLKFCFVPGTGVYSPAQPPWWNKGIQASGAIASPNHRFYYEESKVFPFPAFVNCLETQEVWLDGEDTGFDGHIDYELVPTQYRANLDAFMGIQYGAPHFYVNSCTAVSVSTQK